MLTMMRQSPFTCRLTALETFQRIARSTSAFAQAVFQQVVVCAIFGFVFSNSSNISSSRDCFLFPGTSAVLLIDDTLHERHIEHGTFDIVVVVIVVLLLVQNVVVLVGFDRGDLFIVHHLFLLVKQDGLFFEDSRFLFGLGCRAQGMLQCRRRNCRCHYSTNHRVVVRHLFCCQCC